MCRHLAWLGQPRTLAALVLDPPSSLLVQAHAPRRQRLRGGGETGQHVGPQRGAGVHRAEVVGEGEGHAGAPGSGRSASKASRMPLNTCRRIGWSQLRKLGRTTDGATDQAPPRSTR